MAERRVDPRMLCYLRGEIQHNNSVETLHCEVHDISERGMRLAGADFSKVPQIFRLRIPRRRFNEDVKIVRRGRDGVGVIILSG